MKLKAIFFNFSIPVCLFVSSFAYAENYIEDADKAQIVASYPILGVEPDGSLKTILAYFERMGYEKTQDKYDEATKAQITMFEIKRPPQLIKVKVSESEELGKRTIEFKGSNPDKTFLEQVTDVIVNDLCDGKLEELRAPNNNAALSCVTRPIDMTAVKAKTKDGNGVKYNLSFIRRGDKKMDLIYYREK